MAISPGLCISVHQPWSGATSTWNAFQFGVAYASPPAALERVPALVEEIVARQPGVRFERAHFRAFGETALNFEVVYFVDLPDMRLYLDAQQRINLELMQQLAQAGLSLTPFKPS